EVALTVLRAYRNHLHEFARMSPLEMWYDLIDSEVLIRTAPDRATRRRREKFEKKARTHTADGLIGRLVEEKEGGEQFLDQPPVIARLEGSPGLERSFRTALNRYPS